MSIEIQKAQKAMAAELSAAEKRLIKAKKAVDDARAALKTAEIALAEVQQAETIVAAEFQTLNSKYTQFLELFPLEETPAVGAKSATTAKAKAKKNALTLIEKMLLVMGDKTMSAGQIEHELVTRELTPKTNNLRSYIHTLLGQQTQKVRDAAGNTIRDPNTNELVRVQVFKKVSHGLYCVNKIDPAKFLADLAAKKSNSEVLLVSPTQNSKQSPADALFASQGLDVNSLAPSSPALS